MNSRNYSEAQMNYKNAEIAKNAAWAAIDTDPDSDKLWDAYDAAREEYEAAVEELLNWAREVIANDPLTAAMFSSNKDLVEKALTTTNITYRKKVLDLTMRLSA